MTFRDGDFPRGWLCESATFREGNFAGWRAFREGAFQAGDSTQGFPGPRLSGRVTLWEDEFASERLSENNIPGGLLSRRLTFRSAILPGGRFPGGLLSGRAAFRGGEFPGGRLSGRALSGAATCREGGFPGGRHSGKAAFLDGGFPGGRLYGRGNHDRANRGKRENRKAR